MQLYGIVLWNPQRALSLNFATRLYWHTVFLQAARVAMLATANFAGSRQLPRHPILKQPHRLSTVTCAAPGVLFPQSLRYLGLIGRLTPPMAATYDIAVKGNPDEKKLGDCERSRSVAIASPQLYIPVRHSVCFDQTFVSFQRAFV